jgi:Flp pilus assembly protein TadG
MSRVRGRLARTERGTALVEAALVLPILMMIVLGIIDYGMWDYQTSQTSSAARDGARNASVDVVGTDVCASPCTSPNATPSAANQRVRTAIASKLGSQSFTFTVRCRQPTGSTYEACAVTSSNVDKERVEVTVTWTRPAMTFVSKVLGASNTVQATSTMTISG